MKSPYSSTALSLVPTEKVKRTKYYPEKVNPAIPDEIWESLQDTAALAAFRLSQMFLPHNFASLRNGDKMKLIELALSRGYGGTDGSIRRNLHLHVKKGEDLKGLNALTSLAKLAQDNLPEFSRKMAPPEVVNAEVAPEEDQMPPPAVGSASWRAEKRLADKNRSE